MIRSVAKLWNVGNGRRSPDTLRRWVGSLTAIAVLAVPLAAQLTPCFVKCHGEAMEYINAGGSQEYAEIAIFWPCMEEEC